MGKLEKPSSSYNVGEKVLVLNGPWKDKVVEIAAINDEKETVTVLIELFGRYTPTELSFTQVSKLN
jgi:transcriptional antiterminator NusG